MNVDQIKVEFEALCGDLRLDDQAREQLEALRQLHWKEEVVPPYTAIRTQTDTLPTQAP